MTNSIKLQPLPVERDAYGQWVHPVYQEEWYKTFEDDSPTEDQVDEFLLSLGVTVKTLHLEDDAVDLKDWNPEVPEGYFLVGIWDTEDTPVAVFAKEIRDE